jgi:hypothetical protein
MNINITWINEDKRRYYKAFIYRDLLNDLILVRSWGSLDSKRAGNQIDVLSSQTEGKKQIEKIKKRRKARNYKIRDRE